MEVVYDLDTEARATAEAVGPRRRAGRPPGTDARFVAMVRDLLLERAAVERGETVERAAVGGLAGAVGPVRGGLLPEPARPAAGPQPAAAG